MRPGTTQAANFYDGGTDGEGRGPVRQGVAVPGGVLRRDGAEESALGRDQSDGFGSGQGSEAEEVAPDVGHGSTPDGCLPLPDARRKLRAICAEVVSLQYVDAPDAATRWDQVYADLVIAALYEIPQVLDATEVAT